MCYFAAVQHRLDASRLQPRHLMGPQERVRDPKGGIGDIGRCTDSRKTIEQTTATRNTSILGDAVLLIRAALVPPHVPTHAFAVGGVRGGWSHAAAIALRGARASWGGIETDTYTHTRTAS